MMSLTCRRLTAARASRCRKQLELAHYKAENRLERTSIALGPHTARVRPWLRTRTGSNWTAVISSSGHALACRPFELQQLSEVSTASSPQHPAVFVCFFEPQHPPELLASGEPAHSSSSRGQQPSFSGDSAQRQTPPQLLQGFVACNIASSKISSMLRRGRLDDAYDTWQPVSGTEEAP